jgi:hypothetical protein
MKTTIENILPRQVLDLVRRAPINPMTRGAVRRITDLVVPEEIKEPKLIEDYILTNIKEDRLKKIRKPDQSEMIHFDVSGYEDTYGTCRMDRRYLYSARVNFNISDLSHCNSKGDVHNFLTDLAREAFEMEDGEGLDLDYSVDSWIENFIDENLIAIAEVAHWGE